MTGRGMGSLDKCPQPSQNTPVKAEKFELLSDEALRALAEKMGLDVPPNLDRVFVVEEILDALEEDSAERRSSGLAPVRIEESKFSGLEFDEIDVEPDASPVLDRCYNETSVRVLVRDPSWAFAFWDISEVERSSLRGEEGLASLFLRVFETTRADGADGSEARREFFDIPVSDDDMQWYINLPRPKALYRIELCAKCGGHVRVLARSRELVVPRHHLDSSADDLDPATAELLRLSGLEALDIEPPVDDNPQRILKAGRASE
jgi:hypothetical protein